MVVGDGGGEDGGWEVVTSDSTAGGMCGDDKIMYTYISPFNSVATMSMFLFSEGGGKGKVNRTIVSWHRLCWSIRCAEALVIWMFANLSGDLGTFLL